MKKLLATICVLGLLGMVVGVGVFAGQEAAITTTITPLMVSVTVDIPNIDYGTLGLGESVLSPQINMHSDGTGGQDISIRGTNTFWDSDGLGPDQGEMQYDAEGWILTDWPGHNQYRHEFWAGWDLNCFDENGDGEFDYNPCGWPQCDEIDGRCPLPLYRDPQVLYSIGPGDDMAFQLNFHTPITTDYLGTQQSTVTLIATAQ